MAKNLGQVAGLFIGSTPPENTALIWYDSASSAHKVYNVGLEAWTVLDQTVITPVTYGELVSRAGTTGLTQGEWFKVTDRNDYLALAITSTKIQYADTSGALVIDDLGSNIQYHVTSGNLLIDDVVGVYNTTTGKLEFSFQEATPAMTSGEDDIDFVLAVCKRGANKTLRKFRLSKFLNSDAANAIQWNEGMFLNFGAKLRTFFDTPEGIVSYDEYQRFIREENARLEQLSQNTINAITTIGQNIDEATAPAQIYNKALPTAPTGGAPSDIIQGDTLTTIINKIQRWVNKLKTSIGIAVGPNFTPSTLDNPVVNGNDSVQSALGKLQKNATDLREDVEELQDHKVDFNDMASGMFAFISLNNDDEVVGKGGCTYQMSEPDSSLQQAGARVKLPALSETDRVPGSGLPITVHVTNYDWLGSGGQTTWLSVIPENSHVYIEGEAPTWPEEVGEATFVFIPKYSRMGYTHYYGIVIEKSWT